MSILPGIYSLHVITNSDLISTMQLNILINHEAECLELGQGGRYFDQDGYVLLSFGDTSHFQGITNFSIFAKLNSVNNGFEGIMLDHVSGQRYGCEANLSGVAPVNPTFGAFHALPTWPPTEFVGMEYPNKVHSYYHFDYSSSQIGQASIGIVNDQQGFSGPSTNLTYPSTNEELLVFGTTSLLTYGAVVDRSGNNIKLVNGLYMNPFVSNGLYGTWNANN